MIMESVGNTPEFKLAPNIIVTPPVNEVLGDPLQAAQIWPEIANADPLFADQIQRRTEQSESIQSVIDQLEDPTVTLQEAVESGGVEETQATNFYEALSDLLEDDEYKRLTLYLPVEYIPEASWLPENPSLNKALRRFKEAYMLAWRDLLGVHDVRANFVDGDVLELEHRDTDPLRVVKAAHITPFLIERGLIAETEVNSWFNSIDDPVLWQSLSEGLGAYHGEDITDYNPRPQTASTSSATTTSRHRWLMEERLEKHVISGAEQVADGLLNGDLTPERLHKKLSSDTYRAEEVFVEGVYRAVEASLIAGNRDRAAELYAVYEEKLAMLWEGADPRLRERLASTARRYHQMHLTPSASIDDQPITTPSLETPWSENLPHMADAVEHLKQVTAEMASNTELNRLFYPVVLMGGSRLKGYGEDRSDIDIEIFVKPGVPESDRERIRELMSTVLGSSRRYELTEFWLEDTNEGQLQIRDFADFDRHTADSCSNHLLFGAAWVGDEPVIAELQAKVLPAYFYDNSNRQLHLEKLEQDALQYRLMHKGYARHFPLAARPDWTRSSAVDGDSLFWDAGYRRLATKLFIDTIFLPKLEKPEN